MTISSGSGVVRNGLVFHYDMENSAKSWKGKPTNNLWSNQANVADLNTYASFQMPGVPGGTSVITTDYGTWNSPTKSSIWKVTVGTGTMQSYASWRICLDTGLTAISTTRRLQAKVKMLNGSISDLGYHNGGGTGGATYTAIDPADVPGGVHDKTGWYQLSLQVNWTSTTTGQCVGIGILSQDIEFLVAEPMIATDATSTVPYTPNERTNTQALVDLTGNNTITANSLTYNSDGTFEFNGSSNYANAGVISNLDGSSSISFDAWVRVADLATTDRKIICYKRDANTDANFQLRRGYNSDGLYYQWHNSSWQTFSIDNFFDNTSDYHHVTIVHNPSATPQVICYKNGEQFTTYTGNTTPISWQAATMFIGYRTAAEYFYGDMDSIKIWNRPLTADEVRQNFEAGRGRYGI